jgi:molybdate transport system regulatory protein
MEERHDVGGRQRSRQGAGGNGTAYEERQGRSEKTESSGGAAVSTLAHHGAAGLVLGPGKVELLEAIDRTGSISAAGREMGMSYRRAWLLVSALNEMFGRTLVTTSPGGAGGGGAEVTDFGRAVAEAYRRADERSTVAIREEFARIGHIMTDE